MVALIDRNIEKQTKARKSDEFDSYLKDQRIKTTFNGMEVAEFSWYKKILGVKANAVTK